MRGVEAGRSPGLVVHSLTVPAAPKLSSLLDGCGHVVFQIDKNTKRAWNRAQWCGVAALSGECNRR
jgi:hypothetical protein